MKLICKKDGKQLENLDAITLAKGEILYLMFEGKGTGENAAAFTLSRDDSYIALTDVVNDQKIATLKSGTKYIYIPAQNSTYTATAFTSWYEEDAVASLQYTKEQRLQTGNMTRQPVTTPCRWQKERFILFPM